MTEWPDCPRKNDYFPKEFGEPVKLTGTFPVASAFIDLESAVSIKVHWKSRAITSNNYDTKAAALRDLGAYLDQMGDIKSISIVSNERRGTPVPVVQQYSDHDHSIEADISREMRNNGKD